MHWHSGSLGTVTRYAGLSRPSAAIILGVWLLATAWCFWVAVTRETGPIPPPADPNKRDAVLFRDVVERVHKGESYYDAFGGELRARGYPARSIFNWRLPLFAWLHGKLPDSRFGQALLSALALATVLLVYQSVRRESGVPVGYSAVVLVGLSLTPCLLPNVFLTTDLWAGTLIAFSICSYARAWNLLGLAAGLCALFFRELALPYCLLCVALAWWHERREELWAWAGGLALFAIYFVYHCVEILHHQTSADVPHAEGWVRFGGTTFILTTVGVHNLLAEFPPWTWALYLPLAVLGLAGWRGELGLRAGLTVALYLAAFAIAGHRFNNYWGLIDAPLLALGFVQAPAALRDLLEICTIPRPAHDC
jgi:hypothetical protein